MASVTNLRDYDFQYETTHIIKEAEVGRPDLIAYNIYGSVLYYAPLCAANGIKSPYSTRFGIRPEIDLLKNDNTTVEEGETWSNYFNQYDGIVDELYVGRMLLVPSTQSANGWILRYL